MRKVTLHLAILMAFVSLALGSQAQIPADLYNFNPLNNLNTRANCILPVDGGFLVGRDATGAYNTPCLTKYGNDGIPQAIGNWMVGVSCIVKDPSPLIEMEKIFLVGNDMGFGWHSMNISLASDRFPTSWTGRTDPGYTRVTQIAFNPYNIDEVAVAFFTPPNAEQGGWASYSRVVIYTRNPNNPRDWTKGREINFRKWGTNTGLSASRIWHMEYVSPTRILVSGQGIVEWDGSSNPVVMPSQDCLMIIRNDPDNPIGLAAVPYQGQFSANSNVRDFVISNEIGGKLYYAIGGQFTYTTSNSVNNNVYIFEDNGENASVPGIGDGFSGDLSNGSFMGSIYGAYVNDVDIDNCHLIAAGNFVGTSGTSKVIQGIAGFSFTNGQMDFYGSNLGNTQGFYQMLGNSLVASHDVRTIHIGSDNDGDGHNEIICGGLIGAYRLQGVLVDNTFRNLTRLRGYSTLLDCGQRSISQSNTDEMLGLNDDARTQAVDRFEQAASMDETVLWSISVYPNPSQGQFRIMNSVQGLKCEVTISDYTGKQVYHKEMGYVNGPIDLDVTDLPGGLYLLKVVNGTHTFTEKLVIEKK